MAIRNKDVELFNVGDRVMVGPRGLNNVKSAARMKATVKRVIGDDMYELEFDTNLTNDSEIHHLTLTSWFAQADEIFSVKKPQPSLATAINLKPSARKVLAYLEKHKNNGISPVVAQTVLGNFRLASSIFDLRKAGFDIKTDLRQDDGGHKYANYRLAA